MVINQSRPQQLTNRSALCSSLNYQKNSEIVIVKCFTVLNRYTASSECRLNSSWYRTELVRLALPNGTTASKPKRNRNLSRRFMHLSQVRIFVKTSFITFSFVAPNEALQLSPNCQIRPMANMSVFLHKYIVNIHMHIYAYA